MLTLNGEHVFEGVLSFPRTGAWHADLKVGTLAELSGGATINVDQGKYLLQGTILRTGNWQDTGHLRVVGGAGGLRTIARPKHYTSTSARIVLDDLLADGGESLSPTSDSTVVGRSGGRSLSAWTTAALPVGRLITQLLATIDPTVTWRVLKDGTVWVGHETWPDSKLKDSDFQILDEDPMRAEALLGVESPLLMPGVKLGDRRVSYVEHRLGDPETRTAVWFETGTGTGDDRLRAALRGAVKAAQQPIDYLAQYFGTVVSQTGDRIDVKPTDARIPSMAGVPLFGGLPGWEMKTFPGGRVLIGWSGGDPSLPYALAFDAGVKAQSLALLAQAVVIGDKVTAQPALMTTPYRAAEEAMLTALTTAVQAALTSLGLTGPAAALTAAKAAFTAAAPTFLSTHVRHS